MMMMMCIENKIEYERRFEKKEIGFYLYHQLEEEG